jgi:site-specific recombinase XerD
MATFNRDTISGMIYIHQRVDGKRFRESTHIKVALKDWSGTKAKTNLVMFNSESVNSLLRQCDIDLQLAIADLTTNGGGMKELKEYYRQYRIGKRSIRPVGNKFMDYFKSDYEEQQKAITTTWKHYRTTYRILEEFLQGKSPVFDQIDKKFGDDFQRWLKTDKDAMESTIGGHIKRIKAVMRKASADELHRSRKFEEIKRPKYETDKVALSPVEVEKIAWTVLPPKLDLVKDYFLLSCYTGTRISDWEQLKSSSINGILWKYTANKTKETALVKISDKVFSILEKYGGKLPKMYADQTMNKLIKEVCKEAGLTYNYASSVVKGGKTVTEDVPVYSICSSHTGRRTFATILIHKGIPVHLIMAQTGHNTLTSFESYIKLKKLQTEVALQDDKVLMV